MRVAVDRKPLAYIQTQVCVDYEECGCLFYVSYFVYLGFLVWYRVYMFTWGLHPSVT